MKALEQRRPFENLLKKLKSFLQDCQERYKNHLSAIKLPENNRVTPKIPTTLDRPKNTANCSGKLPKNAFLSTFLSVSKDDTKKIQIYMT